MTSHSHNMVVPNEYARQERAKAAPLSGMLNSLASELVLECPDTEAILIWQRAHVDAGELHCTYTTDPNLILRDWTLLKENARRLGFKQISQRNKTAILVSPWFTTNVVKQLVALPHTYREQALAFCHFDLGLEVDGYLITIFLRSDPHIIFPSEDQLQQTEATLRRYLDTARRTQQQIRQGALDPQAAEGLLNKEPVADFARLTESPIWSLPQIEEVVLQRIRSAIPELSESHLFLINPSDSQLYYAATDQLTFDTANVDTCSDTWQLTSLNAFYTSHIEKRLDELEKKTEYASGTLVDLYRRLLGDGLSPSELSEQIGKLRLILRCLPQEQSCGVVGAAVREGRLQIGGENYWDFSQWKNSSVRPFFYQKLELEKLFGVAKDGYLTAAPVHDAGQVIGGLFFVTPERPDKEQVSALLDGCLHASQLLSQFRTTQFTRSVIDNLDTDPGADFQRVVELHLGQLLLHGMVVVIDNSGNAATVSHAWCREKGQLVLMKNGNGEIRNSRLLCQLYKRMREHNVWLMEVDAQEWAKSNISAYYADPQSCVLFPFDHDTSFMFLVNESYDRLLNSLDALQQKLAALQTVVCLRDTYARRHDVLRFHSDATFSWHNLSRRFSRPLLGIYNRLNAAVGRMGEDWNHVKDSVRELGLLQEIMDSQFLALKDTVDSQEESDNRLQAINVHRIVDNDLRSYFAILLRERDHVVASPYSGSVSLRVECPEGIVVRGKQNDFKMALVSLLENTIKDYAISKELVAAGDEHRLKVTVKVVPGDACTVIHISDTGEGMKDSKIDLHNQRFTKIANGEIVGYQGFDSDISSGKGSGSQIGLLHAATVFARFTGDGGLSRGRIRVKANHPFGTTFVITLPQPSASRGIKR